MRGARGEDFIVVDEKDFFEATVGSSRGPAYRAKRITQEANRREF